MREPPIATFIEGRSALLATAIHAGSYMPPGLEAQCALSATQRLHEEDPFTDRWTSISDNRIMGLHSRFEVDLNRPREKAVYRTPEEAWGLSVWRAPLSAVDLQTALRRHDEFYARVARSVDQLLQMHPRVVIYDLHSYNHQRSGPGRLDDPEKNPEFNLGTANMDRVLWASVVEALTESLRRPIEEEGEHDVRENVKFSGGYFTRWLYERYGARVCPIAIEVKKVFMDEWTGLADLDILTRIGSMLARSVPPVMQATHAIKGAH